MKLFYGDYEHLTACFNYYPFLQPGTFSAPDDGVCPIPGLPQAWNISSIDGGSDDGSRAIIESFADRLAYWESIPDKGQTDAINKGFARATGKYLAWLNSDDVYRPGAIKEAVEYLEMHPEVGMVYGDCAFIDAEDRVIGQFPAAQTDEEHLRRGYVHVPQQASFFRTDLWRKVGPLDPSFYFAMDYDLWVRLAGEAPLVYLPGRDWAGFRLHGDAKTIAADSRCWPEMLRVHYRDGGSRFLSHRVQILPA